MARSRITSRMSGFSSTSGMACRPSFAVSTMKPYGESSSRYNVSSFASSSMTKSLRSLNGVLRARIATGTPRSKKTNSKRTVLQSACSEARQQAEARRVVAQREELAFVHGRVARHDDAKDEPAGEEAAEMPAAVAERRLLDAEDEVGVFALCGDDEVVRPRERDAAAFEQCRGFPGADRRRHSAATDLDRDDVDVAHRHRRRLGRRRAEDVRRHALLHDAAAVEDDDAVAEPELDARRWRADDRRPGDAQRAVKVVGEPRQHRRICELEQAVGDEDGRLEQLDAREIRARPLSRRERAQRAAEELAELPLLDGELVLVVAVLAVERPRAHRGDQQVAQRPALRRVERRRHVEERALAAAERGDIARADV